MADLTTKEAWEQLLMKYPKIPEVVARDGLFFLSAKAIKEFREPRLMTKHDSLEGVPQPLKDLGLNVLPVSRKGYVLGDFKTFAPFPETLNERPEFCQLPYLETLDIEHISSESNAINALLIGGVLDRFLDEPNTVETFNGRMGTGDFKFSIERESGALVDIDVRGAQLEVDGGFENDRSVVIMEAKNVIHSDFQVRQLYYPFRKYFDLVHRKRIRLVFSQYTNLTYRLYEYTFSDPMDYSSLVLVQQKSYILADTRITPEDVYGVWQKTAVRTTDNQNETHIPFIQADKFDRIIAICEYLQAYPDGVATEDIASFMGTVGRQADYYPAAGEYLGLFDRRTRGIVKLSHFGSDIFASGYRDRQLGLVSCFFEHEIFHRLYETAFRNGVLPEREAVVNVMLELNVCNAGETAWRRAGSVLAWLRWLLELPDED